MTAAFDKLHRFLSSEMRMSHVYQPVMLQTLLESGGPATTRQIAEALLNKDAAQLSYYEEITRRMPGDVLRRRGIITAGKGTYDLVGADEITASERHTLIGLCLKQIDQFLARRKDPWAHRRTSSGYIPGTAKYEVLKRAAFRCELCGTSAEVRALEVDHILPRNHGGTDDPTNLQALCYSCNATKRDRDDTDFRGIAEGYRNRDAACVFCQLPVDRVVASNELLYAVRDAYPVTTGHTLLIPKRHVSSPAELHQPELNAMWALAAETRTSLSAGDASINGFNLGFNDGLSAGQTVMHAHVHLIPRRSGDVSEPRGGVRGVIPERQSY
jgi:diadenosine tetraphosphate (Ap4A) HIT family hydrolase